MEAGTRVLVDLRARYFAPRDWRAATFLRSEEPDAKGNTAVVKLDEPCVGCPTATYLGDLTLRVSSHAAYIKPHGG